MAQNLLEVTPLDSITFSKKSNPVLFISNISKIPVTFKLQSTVFDKFKIIPRRGILQPNENIEVHISLIRPSCIISKKGRDRILVLCMPTPSSAMEIATTSCFWRHNICYNPSVEKHQVCCYQLDENENPLLPETNLATKRH